MSHNTLHIPFDLIGEILLKLDVKTLLKCTSVCKCWNSLITSPNFISHYSYPNSRSNYKNEPLLFHICRRERDSDNRGWKLNCSFLCSDNDQTDLLRDLESPPITSPKLTSRSFKVVSACNGLVCLVENPIHSLIFILWNPTLRKYAWLPVPESPRGTLGFGFDRRNNDFKVVKLFTNTNTTWVCSLASRSWKALTNTPPCFLIDGGRTHVSVNGVLHWLACDQTRNYNFVLTLDLANEGFGEVLLPQSISQECPFTGSLSVMARGDSLAVSQMKMGREEACPVWSVWVMKEYGVADSWTKIASMQEQIPEKVFAIRKNEEIILQIGGKILRYNPTTATIMEEWRFRIEDIDFIGNHAESLFLLNKMTGVLSYS